MTDMESLLTHIEILTKRAQKQRELDNKNKHNTKLSEHARRYHSDSEFLQLGKTSALAEVKELIYINKT